jgi:glycine/D-amino acid oxidase-like deaminating enzyme
MAEAIQVDYLIVGQGLAGSALAMACLQRGLSVAVVDDGKANAATRVAAGLVTTLAGKGMNPAWRQERYLPEALEYYRRLEAESGRQLFYPLPVLRLFGNEKERLKFQNKTELHSEWIQEVNPSFDEALLHAAFGGFEMAHSGRLDTQAYLDVVRERIVEDGEFFEAGFAPEEVELNSEGVRWKDVRATKLILSQGFRGLGQGWFGFLPHRSAKGEMLTVRAEQLDESRILNRDGWMVPIGDGLWRAGATYEWEQLDGESTEAGRLAVEEKVQNLPRADYTVVREEAGVRPIVQNSQPVVGVHPEFPQLGIFNGLGSKGVITAPSVAEHFLEFLTGESALDPELSLQRFLK